MKREGIRYPYQLSIYLPLFRCFQLNIRPLFSRPSINMSYNNVALQLIASFSPSWVGPHPNPKTDSRLLLLLSCCNSPYQLTSFDLSLNLAIRLGTSPWLPRLRTTWGAGRSKFGKFMKHIQKNDSIDGVSKLGNLWRKKPISSLLSENKHTKQNSPSCFHKILDHVLDHLSSCGDSWDVPPISSKRHWFFLERVFRVVKQEVERGD